MAKKNNLRRTRKQNGGGWAFTGATIDGVNNYGQVNTPIGDCRAVSPPGFISPPYPQKGLPGLSGGGKRKRRTMKGGRYGFDLANPVPGAAAPWAGGIPPVQRIACEGSTPNPLNPGPHTPSTAPPAPSGNSFLTFPLSGGRRKRRQGGGGLGTDNLAYYAPTAGYDNQASRWVDSVGAPVLLQKPYDAQAWNPACVKTGGKRKNSRRNRRSSRKNTRRSTRK
jgi:hypothetical protein